MSPGIGRVVRIFATLSIALFATCGASLPADEFVCEEAHARLTQCCPGFKVEDGYCMSASGCGARQYTALSEEESQCIRRLSCDSLRDTGICDRAGKLKPEVFASSDSRAPYQRERVCP